LRQPRGSLRRTGRPWSALAFGRGSSTPHGSSARGLAITNAPPTWRPCAGPRSPTCSSFMASVGLFFLFFAGARTLPRFLGRRTLLLAAAVRCTRNGRSALRNWTAQAKEHGQKRAGGQHGPRRDRRRSAFVSVRCSPGGLVQGCPPLLPRRRAAATGGRCGRPPRPSPSAPPRTRCQGTATRG
jgi:hypothetical protein